MAKADQIACLFSWATIGGVLQYLRFWRSLLAFVLMLTLVIAQRSIVFSQSPTATPEEAKKEVNQTSDSSSQTDGASSDDQADDKDKAAPKKEKRGSLVIALIPISSPAFGSGLLLIVGYVFK